MIQIFIFGSSSSYGVGGSEGGWADLLKKEIHERAYSDAGTGERYEVFNFGKSGAKISFVRDTFKDQLKHYKRDNGESIALVAIGGNNAKAETEPDNFVSTVEEYESQLTSLLENIKQHVDTVVFVGSGSVDESKTNPKHNPLTGGKSYFTNERRTLFESKLKEICQNLDVPLVELKVDSEEWRQKYLYKDGLHPNDAGYRLMFEKILDQITPFL